MTKKERVWYGTGGIILLIFSFYCTRSTFGFHFDRIITDTITDTTLRPEVVVVGIDDASLKSLGAWPFDRSIFAKVVDNLYAQGAREVVFDVLFLENRKGDKDMVAVLSKNKINTIFAEKFDQKSGLIRNIYTGNQYAKGGIAHVYPDDDGKVRSVELSQLDSFGVCYPSLAYEAFIEYTHGDMHDCDSTPRMFLYQDTPPHTLSLVDVYNNNIQSKDVAGKIVFIGSTSLDLEDHFVGTRGEKMAGVYVHVSIFSTLLNRSFVHIAPVGMVALFVCVLVLIAMYIPFRIRKTSLQIMVILGVSLFSILITYITAHYKYLLSTSLLLLPYIIISVYSIMFRYGITEKHNEHVRSLFGKYVHKDVLDELLQHGKDIKLGGERRVVSILFSDIRGFTSFSETMSPEELTSLLNGYLSAMSPKILEEKGTIDKFIGDAIMAFWNAPLRIEQHELHAVKAALLMVDALELFNKEYGSPLAVGIGVHTGEVVVGNIGSLDRVNYTVLGDVVNTASRLEGLTKKYGVSLLVSDEIRNKVQDDNIIFRKLDTITVKGKSEPTIIYEVGRKGNISSDTITQYEKGLALYGDGALDAAYVIFKSLAEQGDIPSMKMTEKIPSIDRKTWDGVWHFDEK